MISVMKKPTAWRKKKKAGTRLIHQDDSYLGSLRLDSASRGLSRLVKGHGELRKEKSLLNVGDGSTRLGAERARCSHQDSFMGDAESNCRESSVQRLGGP